MDAVSIVNRIYQITRLIYDQTKKVKANQAQCQRLSERVKLIEQTLRGLQKIEDSEVFRGSWRLLETRLTEGLTLIQSFSGAKWYQQFFQAQSQDKAFEAVNKNLQEAIQQLNLGLSAQQIVNREQDRADQRKDYEALRNQQEEILMLQEQAMKELHRLPKIHEAILVRQLASLKLNLREVMQRLSPDQKDIKVEIKPKTPFEAHYYLRHHELAMTAALPLGRFGAVYQGQWHEQTVAIRWLPEQFTPQDEKLFIRSVQLMARLNHPCLPKFYGACLEDRHACWVMEYCPEGDVLTFVKRRTPNAVERREWALSLMSGLSYLHSQSIVHGNLKPSNVLTVRSEDRWQARISDFHSAQTAYHSLGSAQARATEQLWFSPEMQRGDNLTAASDVYQLGLLLWTLCTGRALEKDWKPAQAEEAFYVSWIERCCQPDPARRPSLMELSQALKAYTPAKAPAPIGAPAVLAEAPVAAPAAAPAAAAKIPVETLNLRGVEAEKSGDLKAARAYYQQASDAGSPSGLASLGAVLIQDRSDASNAVKAFACFQRAAEQGHIRGMFNLAEAYARGDGAAKDEKQAAHWYRQAAEQGYARAQCELGICYLKGRGVGEDQKSAVSWFKKASDQKFGKGTFNLGFCYERGFGVPKDKPQALALYAQASREGYAEAGARHTALAASLAKASAQQGVFQAALASDKSPVPPGYQFKS